MKYLIFIILCWQFRKTPYYDMLEQYVLTLKAARRCAYDLKHCSSDLSMYCKDSIVDYHERAEMWQTIFTPTGGKDYRHELHSEIMMLEIKLKKAVDLLDKNGIEHNLKDIPF
ncbi:MAG: hypothetical protein GOVbin8609_64 [Prokaryotic dsDNA virus sp.]|nr:MAG: hypothetical protein GOVbin8609_64 [Prokaryotic dsDNA virus sp.]|tara:strand:- start:11583 stop:11921 length:339 start_codon:yes stop_codon:yes gene_type:complete